VIDLTTEPNPITTVPTHITKVPVPVPVPVPTQKTPDRLKELVNFSRFHKQVDGFSHEALIKLGLSPNDMADFYDSWEY
jgi:hypothetical protein